MTEQEFERNVLDRLSIPVPVDDNIFERLSAWVSIRYAIHQLYEFEFSIDDAVAYMKCTEEVNPHLSEEIALSRMSQIGNKYKKYRQRRSKSHTI